MKKILITGKNSYVGNSFYDYIIKNFSDEYQVDKISLKEQKVEDIDLSGYDSILHVAGIAHSDYGNISEDRAKEYYNINTDLTIKFARIAKKKKVKQFVFMSSIIVYGESAPIGIKKVITKETVPAPKNAYGDSKLKAEEGIKDLNDENFKVAIIRAPMICGKNSKGNYKTLEKLALKLPVFPRIENERSVINIDRLCSFIKEIIDDKKSGIFFPQDEEYMNTSLMVKRIANDNGKNVILIRGFGILLKILSGFMPVINKAFGNLVYSKDLKHIKI